jgi:L-threonylcarbamoyladenylate synthase
MIIVSEDISKAAEILKEENLVAIPTETVYGLAGNIAK